MKPYYADDVVTLYLGDCRDLLPAMEATSVDAVVTDPPYDLTANKKGGTGAASLNLNSPAGRSRISTGGGFMGREWDATGVAFEPETWRAVLRVLKPGGHLLAFGGTRTWHRMVCAIEDAGFEIRDSIDWIYGTGFPKNPACLKPAHEPIVMARKPSRTSPPLPGLDACKVEHASEADLATSKAKNPGRSDTVTSAVFGADRPQQSVDDAGRWPPNVVLSDEAAAELDRQSGYSSERRRTIQRSGERQMNGWGLKSFSQGVMHADSGGASRFFPVFKYEPKAPAAERPRLPDGTEHTTVKPLDLMRWLVRLVTPSGGTVLDPFAGSGTTGEACVIEGFSCILAEQDPASAELIRVRLSKPIQPVMFEEPA